jgi:hypothetical protein
MIFGLLFMAPERNLSAAMLAIAHWNPKRSAMMPADRAPMA